MVVNIAFARSIHSVVWQWFVEQQLIGYLKHQQAYAHTTNKEPDTSLPPPQSTKAQSYAFELFVKFLTAVERCRLASTETRTRGTECFCPSSSGLSSLVLQHAILAALSCIWISVKVFWGHTTRCSLESILFFQNLDNKDRIDASRLLEGPEETSTSSSSPLCVQSSSSSKEKDPLLPIHSKPHRIEAPVCNDDGGGHQQRLLPTTVSLLSNSGATSSGGKGVIVDNQALRMHHSVDRGTVEEEDDDEDEIDEFLNPSIQHVIVGVLEASVKEALLLLRDRPSLSSPPPTEQKSLSVAGPVEDLFDSYSAALNDSSSIRKGPTGGSSSSSGGGPTPPLIIPSRYSVRDLIDMEFQVLVATNFFEV